MSSLTEERQDARLFIGEGAVLTLTRAAEILGFNGADRWLRDEGLVSVAVVKGEGKTPRRVERVVWRRVLAHLEEAPEQRTQAEPPKRAYRLADV